MSEYSFLQKIIDENRSFLLSTHINPDGDAIGSEIAFYVLLKRLGKNVRIVNYSSTPYNLEFLDDGKVIEKFDRNSGNNMFSDFDVFILLDLNRANRISKMEEGLRFFKGLRVCIDHHQDIEEIFDCIIGGTEFSATAEIIYDFIKKTRIVEIDYTIALQLYAGIMTDTGSFRFDRTTPHLHEIAAELISAGVDPTEVYDRIYNQFKFGRVKLLGEALSTVELDATRQIAYMTVTRECLDKNNSTEEDIDGFVNYCLTIRNVKIGILFYEMDDGVKVSFRSKGDVPVNKLAGLFDGGGHTNAAGARLTGVTIAGIKDKIITEAQKFIAYSN
jgi:phosphoesterase RecJ-like protein